MKKIKQILLLSMTIISLLAVPVTTYASENYDFQEVKVSKKVFDLQSEASEKATVASLGSCSLSIDVRSNGVGLTYFTSATVNATEIGIKNFKLYEKTLIGWREMSINNYCTYNSDYHSGEVVYTGAVAGKRYKASCTHYAKINGVEYTLNATTSEITYN